MSGSVGVLMQFVRAHATPPQSDVDLLHRVAEQRDDSAFAQIIERYGPFVLGICRRILRDVHEAEDAFQATFLLLSRKAASLREPERLGGWLHGVACRIARRSLRQIRRRPSSLQPEYDPPMPLEANPEVVRELRTILDEVVLSLPAKYREPIVLCYMQGLTNAEAARRLGCPPGTVATRLSRARGHLHSRLVRRGVVLPAALMAMYVSQAGAVPILPIALRQTTVAHFAAPATANVSWLIEGMGKSMLLEKSRLLAAAFVVLSAGTLGLVSYHSTAEEPARPAVKEANAPNNPATTKTPNFIVECAEPRCARLVAEMAELQRKQIAVRGLGKELPNWAVPCKIHVKITDRIFAASMWTLISREKNAFFVAIEGPLDQVLADQLPYCVAQTVIATHFGKPIPRWAEIGITNMSLSPEEANRLPRQSQELFANSHGMRLTDLVSRKDNQIETLCDYAQSRSLVMYLVGRKDHATFLDFVKDGMADNWNKAATKHYGFIDLVEMEEAWRNWIAGPSTKTFKERAAERADRLVQDPGPVTALCFAEDGQIAVILPTTKKLSMHAAKNVKAFQLDGVSIETAALLQRLKKETAVLLSDDGKVDPIYLRLIKAGTIILVLPPTLPPPREVLEPK